MPTLDWIGKEAVVEHHRRVPFHLLRDVPELAAGDPDTGNLIVEGDNLTALKALLPFYAGRVKCIYIDPPYNTGNEGWAYNDNVNSPEIRQWLGETVGKEAEDLSRHDKWCCMMYPRLALLRELLADDGSIWISLDDNEVHHARVLLDDIFGAKNFVATVIWQKRTSPDSRIDLGAAHDYVIVYAKQKYATLFNLVPLGEDRAEDYRNPDNDPRGPWASVDLTGQTGHATDDQFFNVKTPSGKIYPPADGRCWALIESTFLRLVEENRIWFGVKGDARPRLKKFLSEVEGVRSWTWWPNQEVGHNQEAKKELIEIIGDSLVPGEYTPKPTRLIQRILQIATGPDDLVLDAFAGSGTTAHAVLKQNALDGGNRRFVLVEMEDKVARPVTAERVRRAVEGYAFSGNDRVELLREKLSYTKLKRADKLLERVDALKEEHADRFDRFDVKVEKDHLVLTGVRRVEEKKEGLGGGFRFATLGPKVFDAEGRIRQDIRYDELAPFVFFLATGRPLEGAPADPPFLGVSGGVGVYLLYNGVLKDRSRNGGNVLTRAVLAELPAHDGPRVVYGTATTLSTARLEGMGIQFRQIPYALQQE